MCDLRLREAAAILRGGLFLLALAVLTFVTSPAFSAGAPTPSAIRMSEATRQEIIQEFVLANVEFTLLHEFGHAIIDHFPIPVFGLEEDAADQIATIIMIQRYDMDVDPMAVSRLLAVSSEWLEEWLEEERKTPRNAHAYWDSHSLAIQRFYNVNCLLFGSNPDDLEFLFDTEGLPAERGFDCDVAYERVNQSLTWFFETHGRNGEEPVPYIGVQVTYEETRTPEHARLRSWIQKSGLVQDLASRASEMLPWPEPILVRFVNCPGGAEAYYNANVSEITVCYELIELFRHRTERSIARNVRLVCANVGLRRLYGETIGCPMPHTPRPAPRNSGS